MVLLHQSEELDQQVMAMLHAEYTELDRNIECCMKSLQHTLAVVVLQAGKAFAAASIASFVSANPISGIVPSSSLLKGSGGRVYHQ